MYGLNTVLKSQKQYTLHQIILFPWFPWQSGQQHSLSSVLTSQMLTATWSSYGSFPPTDQNKTVQQVCLLFSCCQADVY